MLDGAGETVGCGFICAPRQIVTCSHVVESCLGRLPAIGDSVVATFPAAEGITVRLTVKLAFDPHPAPGTDPRARLCRDICVLDLASDLHFPDGVGSVRSSLDRLTTGMDFVGVGVAEKEIRSAFTVTKARVGVQLSGRTGEFDTGNRVFASSLVEDMSIRSGCSGAAIFNEQVGLIGMVVENQEKITGLIVPIQIIRQVVDLPVGATAAAAPPVTSGGRDWSRRFRQFDRSGPVADFADLLGRRWKKESRGFLCAIGGVTRDAPERCRDRFAEKYLTACFPDLAGSETLPDMIDLQWPTTQRSFDVERYFQRMRNDLAEKLGATSPDPATVRAAFNDGNQAKMFVSLFDQRNSTPAQIALLRRWGAYFAEINAERLAWPLIHVFLIELDDTLFEADSPEPDLKLREAYEAICDEVNAGLPEAGQLHPTELLEFFRVDSVVRWVKQTGRAMDLDEAAIGATGERAESALGDRRYLRLEDIRQWVGQIGP